MMIKVSSYLILSYLMTLTVDRLFYLDH